MELRPLALAAVLATTPFLNAQVSPAEVESLKARADAATRAIGDLASSGKLTANDEAVKQLQRLVDELKQIRERLTAIEASLSGAKPTPPPPPKPAPAPGLTLGGYTQFQYQDTDREGGTPTFDAFRFRRIRIALDDKITDRIAARVSVDFAAGDNQLQAQLRDAFATYALGPAGRENQTRIQAGQFGFPVGYELERSSGDREFPERAAYNRTLFAGERGRGLQISRQEGDFTFRIGGFNALSIGDPEQIGLAPGPGNRLAMTAGVRYEKGPVKAGVSGLAGERPSYNAGGATSPLSKRRFAYADAEWRGAFLPRLTLRGEAMVGFDRVPNAKADPKRTSHDLAGFHLMGLYRLGKLDQVGLKWEGFDSDLDGAGTALHGYGLAYLRNVAPNTRLTLAHEVFVDRGRAALGQQRFGQTTIRLQVRF